MSPHPLSAQLSLTPIGYVRTQMRTKFDAPSQPCDETEERNIIELLPGQGFEQALSDLIGFERIWLLWWFHKNKNWKPKVLPPRGPRQKRGVFATRAPYRPNPIGITAVRLLEISGRQLVVGNLDLLDGTPILDIKPYLTTVDSFPNSRIGWLANVEAQLEAPPSYTVHYAALAAEQLAWLSDPWEIRFADWVTSVLERTPTPHRTRRIIRCKDGSFRIACGPWRLFFTVHKSTVTIERITPGFPKQLLTLAQYETAPDRDAQLAFFKRWG